MLSSPLKSPSNPTPAAKPAQPTMTSASLIPPLEPVVVPGGLQVPAELAEDITAMPMTLPDFVNVPLASPNMAPRWIFTDRRRYSQARAQGWVNVQKKDVKPGYAGLSPYEEEGGTKYINGDLILMMIDRKRYLGALRYKHQVAAAFADAAVQRRVSAERAVGDMGSVVANVNKQRIAQGADPVMSVFTPGAADTHETILGQPGVAAKELGRIGNAPRDMGTGQDLANETDKS